MVEKYDFSEFRHGMFAGVEWTSLSMSETTDLGVLQTAIYRVYTNCCTKQPRHNWHFCGQKHIVDERGRNRIVRVV